MDDFVAVVGGIVKTVARVFVSSARGAKLDQYRQVVIDVLHRFGFEPVFMENFSPTRQSPADLCRDLVRGCDAMIVLVAHRYGSLVPDDDRSYTELEFDVGRELDAMELMVWTVQDDAEWRPSEIDVGQNRERLIKFKNKLQGHTTGSFDELVRFRTDVSDAVSSLRLRLDATPQPALPTGWSVSGLKRSRVRAPGVAAYPAYVGSFEFTGRQEQLAWLDRWAESSDAVAVVEAIGGTGKSALTWKWFHDNAPRTIDGLAGRFWWSFYDSSNTLRKFLQVLYLYATGAAEADVESLDDVELMEATLEVLSTQPFLVVMDGFERLLNAYHRFDASSVSEEEIVHLPFEHARAITDPLANEFVRRATLLRRSRILISSRLLPRDLEAFGGILLPGVRHFILPGLRTSETRRLLTSLGVRHSYSNVRTFFNRLDNHPLLIGVVVGMVRDYRPAPGDFDAWLADPDHGQRFSVADIPLTERRHHILEQALAGLDDGELALLRRIVAHGSVTTWEMMQEINPYRPDDSVRQVRHDPDVPAFLRRFVEERRAARETSGPQDIRLALTRLDAALAGLQARGLLWWNHEANSYDLHPVVRAYVSDTTETPVRHLANGLLLDHFGRTGEAEDPHHATSVDDLTANIAFFRALIMTKRYSGAARLWDDRLNDPLLFRLGAYLVAVQLLRAVPEEVRLATSLEWALANAEHGVGHHREAAERRAALVRRAVGETEWRASLLGAVFNLGLSLGQLGRSSDQMVCEDILRRLTHVLGSAESDRARWRGCRASRLAAQGCTASALALVEELIAGPFNRWSPLWLEDLRAEQALYRWRLGWPQQAPLRLDRNPFGASASSQENWASFVHRVAQANGDWALALEAALMADRWQRVQGQESLPAAVAHALAELGRRDEARKTLEGVLSRLDRVEEPQRPHLGVARAWLALGDLTAARQHALLAYRQAWQDGPTSHDVNDVAEVAEVLETLGVRPPALPSREPDVRRLPFGDEILALLAELERDAPGSTKEGER